MVKPTMRDIARLAGVSKATVSRAVHSPHLVRTDTRDRIFRIMNQEQYIYNTQAAELSLKKTTMIGLIMGPFS
ncbi:MAG TPA: LacI family DNA-binding transcriptional regulator [Spirochaetia bacterium]|nr:LacI family DNA-binding transcriptional regulator [Spirochaetia bacterium]